MKFTVNRLLMYQAVKTVLKIVRPNKEIPELGGLLIEADESSGMPVSYTHLDVYKRQHKKPCQLLRE